MSRVAVCLFLIAILHTGIIKFSQANETSSDGISKNDVETTTKPTKVEADEKSGVSSEAEPKIQETSDVPVKKDDKPKEKEAKDNESKKDDVTEKTVSSNNKKFLPDLLKGGPVEQTKVLFEFPKKFLGPVNAVGVKIGDAVSKGIDTAKDLAGGTFNFFRDSATSLFEI